jgi:hypothetical protein
VCNTRPILPYWQRIKGLKDGWHITVAFEISNWATPSNTSLTRWAIIAFQFAMFWRKIRYRGKVHRVTDQDGPQRKYGHRCTLALTSVLDGGVNFTL